MTLRDHADLIRSAPPLAPDETAARAIRLLRARGLPALPVAQAGRLVGTVHEEDLAALAAAAPDPAAAAQLPVSQLMRPITTVAHDYDPLAEVLRGLRDTNASAVPVIAAGGRCLGLALRRDLLAALVGESPVPPIAGLATPFGVYLTTGAVRAGAGDLALVSTGVALMIINLLSLGLVSGLAKLIAPWLSLPVETASTHLGLAVVVAAYLLQVAVFLFLLRLSPLTGVHAAEHMVVRAIEEGEDLALEKVRAMPRVHPRCGTNLMALLILLLVSVQFLSSMDEAAQVPALFALVVIVLLTWRRLGAGLQRWVTTRRPSDRHLAAAVRVAQELLTRARGRPAAGLGPLRRVWHTGFVQVMLGFLALAALAEYGWPLMVAAWSHHIG